jgi:hypothetical protein
MLYNLEAMACVGPPSGSSDGPHVRPTALCVYEATAM